MSAIRGNKTEIANQKRLIRKEVKGQMYADGMTAAKMAARLGISERSFYRLMDDPSKMTLAEAWRLADVMDWKHETAGKVLFG